jgi:hypothetical protein
VTVTGELERAGTGDWDWVRLVGWAGGGLQRCISAARTGVRFGSAVETLEFDWPRWPGSDAIHHSHTSQPSLQRLSYRAVRCLCLMPVYRLSVRVGVGNPGQRKTDSSGLWMRLRWGGDGCHSLGLQASLAR